MIKSLCFVLLFASLSSVAQDAIVFHGGLMRAELHRQDSITVAFLLDIRMIKGEWKIAVVNADERIELTNIRVVGDSVNFALPVFESEFKTKVQPDGSLRGTWFKGTANQTQQWIFTTLPYKRTRFDVNDGNAKFNVSGRWTMILNRPSTGNSRPAVAELEQKGNRLTGTVLTPSGDYRYMEGVVSGNTIDLSVFDGAHAFYFRGKIDDENRMSGNFYSGYAGVENWKAEKNAKAQLPDVGNVPKVKDGQTRLNFTFKDLDRNMVSINDERFKNKVVVVQLMGSWCPNCLDETKFLSNYYNQNKNRGVEMIALAYEYSTDFERSRASLDKFRKLHNVQYPMLITGAWINDSLRTEKTLPQITPIKAFPTTLFIGKDGQIKKIEAGFSGPGTGLHFEAYRREFEGLVEKLLRE